MSLLPAADVLVQFLLDRGVALRNPVNPQWGIVVGGQPLSDVDNYLSVDDNGGALQGRMMRTGEYVKRPSVIVTIRSRLYPTGFAKGTQVEDALSLVGKDVRTGGYGLVQVKSGGAWYVFESARLTVPTTKIGREEQNRREVFVLNANLTLRPLT